jgi:L-iditol 2-dehydrogenase
LKAAVLTGVQNFELRQVPDPQPPRGGLIVKVETCAICGTDVKMYKYGYSAAKLPLIPGHELAGTIAEVGENIQGYHEGERVAVAPNIPCGTCFYCQRGMQTSCDRLQTIGVHRDGGFAQYVMIPPQAVKQECVIPIPKGISFEEAALIDPASCAINACELSRVKVGDVVVVMGAGPAGCLNVEVCRAFGAQKIILVQRSLPRLKQAEFTGADVYISPLRENVIERVMQETEENGADVVIVACGSGEAQQQALKMVAKRGNVNLFGGLPKDNPFIKFDSNLIHYKEAFVIGTHGCSTRQCKMALDMIASGKIKAKEYISCRLGLSDFLQAIKLAEERKGLKIFVIPNL